MRLCVCVFVNLCADLCAEVGVLRNKALVLEGRVTTLTGELEGAKRAKTVATHSAETQWEEAGEEEEEETVAALKQQVTRLVCAWVRALSAWLVLSGEWYVCVRLFVCASFLCFVCVCASLCFVSAYVSCLPVLSGDLCMCACVCV